MLIFVLAGLVASGFAFVHHLHAPPAEVQKRAAAAREASAELKEAGDQLYLTKKWADTYEGPDLKNFPGVQIARADWQGFCIQVVKYGYAFRLVGPGGKPEPGGC